MPERQRNQGGKFVQKSDEVRKVRSIRLTDSTWNELGKIADERDITRADLIEDLIKKGLSKHLETESPKQLELPLNAQFKLERSNLEEKRDRVLNDLKLGKQAPLYKKVKKAMDIFVGMLLD